MKKFSLLVLSSLALLNFAGCDSNTLPTALGKQAAIPPMVISTAQPAETTTVKPTPAASQSILSVPTIIATTGVKANIATPSSLSPQASQKTIVVKPTTTTKVAPAKPASGDTYTNGAGHEVKSPLYSDAVPEGASAKCKDGTYSFSENRKGTCSGHGGVASWLP